MLGYLPATTGGTVQAEARPYWCSAQLEPLAGRHGSAYAPAITPLVALPVLFSTPVVIMPARTNSCPTVLTPRAHESGQMMAVHPRPAPSQGTAQHSQRAQVTLSRAYTASSNSRASTHPPGALNDPSEHARHKQDATTHKQHTRRSAGNPAETSNKQDLTESRASYWDATIHQNCTQHKC